MRHLRRAALAALAFSCAGLEARAWDLPLFTGYVSPLQPGQWFVGAAGTFGRAEFPTVRAFGRDANPDAFVSAAGNPFDIPATAQFGGGAGQIGFVFRDGSFPTWMGRRVRLNLEGLYVQGSTSSSQSGLSNNGFIDFMHIDVNGVDVLPGGGTAAGANVAQTLDFAMRTSRFELALRLTSDFALSESWSVAPAIGVFGGSQWDDYTLRYAMARASGLFVNPLFTRGRLDSWRVGGDIGAELQYRATPFLRFSLGGRLGLAHVSTSMNADGCVNDSAGSPTAICENAPGARFFASRSETRSALSFRAGLRAGAEYDFDWLIAAIGGFLSYDTKTPGFHAQTMTDFAPGGSLNQSGQPARIVYDSRIAYGVFVTLRVPFGPR